MSRILKNAEGKKCCYAKSSQNDKCYRYGSCFSGESQTRMDEPLDGLTRCGAVFLAAAVADVTVVVVLVVLPLMMLLLLFFAGRHGPCWTPRILSGLRIMSSLDGKGKLARHAG